MKKLFLSFVLLVSSACACLARSVQSEPIFAIYPEDSLTLKYYLSCEDKDCFVKFRLITRSTDVWEGGNELTFTCKDGTQQVITCDNNLDDNGFHAVQVKTPVFAHMLTGITAIRLKHKKQQANMQLLPYTSSKTRNGVKQVANAFVKDIEIASKKDSLYQVIDSLKMQNVKDFHYIERPEFTEVFQALINANTYDSLAKQEKKALCKSIKHEFYFALDEYKKKAQRK